MDHPHKRKLLIYCLVVHIKQVHCSLSHCVILFFQSCITRLPIWLTLSNATLSNSRHSRRHTFKSIGGDSMRGMRIIVFTAISLNMRNIFTPQSDLHAQAKFLS